jgi:uncharacterized protein YciI
MLWIIVRMDKPDSGAARDRVMKPHRDYLKERESIIVVGGPLLSDDGTTSIGSFHMVNAESRAEAQAFADGDPFTQAGVFSSISVARLRPGTLNLAAAGTP